MVAHRVDQTCGTSRFTEQIAIGLKLPATRSRRYSQIACIMVPPSGGGPKGRKTGSQKAFRGGGWMESTTTMRAAMRNGTDPNTKINWMGFRCARDVQGEGTRDVVPNMGARAGT